MYRRGPSARYVYLASRHTKLVPQTSQVTCQPTKLGRGRCGAGHIYCAEEPGHQASGLAIMVACCHRTHVTEFVQFFMPLLQIVRPICKATEKWCKAWKRKSRKLHAQSPRTSSGLMLCFAGELVSAVVTLYYFLTQQKLAGSADFQGNAAAVYAAAYFSTARRACGSSSLRSARYASTKPSTGTSPGCSMNNAQMASSVRFLGSAILNSRRAMYCHGIA